MTNFSDPVNPRFKISNWFLKIWEYAKPDPNFQVAKIAIYGIFWPFSEFLRTPWKETIKDFPCSNYSNKTSLVGNILLPKPNNSLKSPGQISKQISVAFWKMANKP